MTEEWAVPSVAHYRSPRLAEIDRVAIAAFGPFRVLNKRRVALVGVTNLRTPAQFAAMLRAYPALATLEFIECPGTYDDLANLQLGRMIRAAGLASEVFAGGSVRSGAVELFLAGTTRAIADDAEFAVHAWIDDRGMGALDYAANAPENAKYLVYYREMGMTQREATRFYAMTNSVPFEDPRWLTGVEMRGWMGQTTVRLQDQPDQHANSRSIAPRKPPPATNSAKIPGVTSP